jgi:hypothetical protein
MIGEISIDQSQNKTNQPPTWRTIFNIKEAQYEYLLWNDGKSHAQLDVLLCNSNYYHQIKLFVTENEIIE